MLRRILKLHLSASRTDTLTMSSVRLGLRKSRGRQGAGEWPPLSVPTAPVTEGQTAAHRAARTCPESRSRWWHGENLSPETSSVKATDSMETGNFPALPGPPPPAPRHLPLVGRRPQNSFSLPELQCFISDSQLTRDAALHLRLGDRRRPRRGSLGGGGPGPALPQLPTRLPAPSSGWRLRPLGPSLNFPFSLFFLKELYGNKPPSPSSKCTKKWVCNTFTKLCNHRHNQFWNISSLQKKTRTSPRSAPPGPVSPRPGQATFSL